MSSSSNTQNKRPSRQTPEPKAGDRQSPCAVKNTCLSGLIAPLRQLDQRLQQTIEVVQLFQGTAFQGCLMGGILPAEQPANVMVEGSALHRLSQMFGLSAFDVGVVVMAIAPELDRRYERLYGRLQSGEQAALPRRKLSLMLALNLLCNSRSDRLGQQKRLLEGSPLLQLLQPLADTVPASNQILQLNPLVSRYLLGQRSLDPTLASVCQLSQPQVPCHAAFLFSAELVTTIQSAMQQQAVGLPLTIKLLGSVKPLRLLVTENVDAIAAIAQAPLLRVNLTQLAHSVSQKVSARLSLVDQVILQAQLWNAALFVESDLELPTFAYRVCRPGLAQSLSAQLSAYPGITIFTDDSAYDAEQPIAKNVILIPLTETQTKSPYQRNISHRTAEEPNETVKGTYPDVGLVQRASQELEKFRRLLIRSSVELSE